MTQITPKVSISVYLTNEIFLDSYYAALDHLCTPVEHAHDGDIIAMHNSYQFGRGDEKNIFRAAVLTECGIRIMDYKDMIMEDAVTRDTMRKFAIAQEAMPLVSKDCLHVAHYDRCISFNASPKFSIFLAPGGIVGVADHVDLSGQLAAAQSFALTDQRTLDGLLGIYLPAPQSAHDQIRMPLRLDAIGHFNNFMLNNFCDGYSMISSLPMKTHMRVNA
jgi:hypothetical protein